MNTATDWYWLGIYIPLFSTSKDQNKDVNSLHNVESPKTKPFKPPEQRPATQPHFSSQSCRPNLMPPHATSLSDFSMHFSSGNINERVEAIKQDFFFLRCQAIMAVLDCNGSPWPSADRSIRTELFTLLLL